MPPKTTAVNYLYSLAWAISWVMNTKSIETYKATGIPSKLLFWKDNYLFWNFINFTYNKQLFRGSLYKRYTKMKITVTFIINLYHASVDFYLLLINHKLMLTTMYPLGLALNSKRDKCSTFRGLNIDASLQQGKGCSFCIVTLFMEKRKCSPIAVTKSWKKISSLWFRGRTVDMIIPQLLPGIEFRKTWQCVASYYGEKWSLECFMGSQH